MHSRLNSLDGQVSPWIVANAPSRYLAAPSAVVSQRKTTSIGESRELLDTEIESLPEHFDRLRRLSRLPCGSRRPAVVLAFGHKITPGAQAYNPRFHGTQDTVGTRSGAPSSRPTWWTWRIRWLKPVARREPNVLIVDKTATRGS
jgi:hypothetical protein